MEKRQITDELINQICTDYFTNGKSLNYLHAKYGGLTYKEIREIITAHGEVRSTKRVGNPDIYKGIIEDWANDINDIQYLARKYNVCTNTVYKVLHYNGIWTNGHKPKVDRKRIWELHEQGKTIIEIADIVKCSRNLVYRLVKEYKANHYAVAMQETVDKQREELYNSIIGGDEMALVFYGKLQKNNTVTIPQTIQVALGLKCGDTVAFEIVPQKADIIVQVKKQDKEEE